jgi:peptide/nickel transport system permease protein
MLILIAKRLSFMVLTMVVVSILLFLVLEISPGSVATKVLGQFASEEHMA